MNLSQELKIMTKAAHEETEKNVASLIKYSKDTGVQTIQDYILLLKWMFGFYHPRKK